MLVLSLLKSARRAGADFMNDAYGVKRFSMARAKCASDNAITGAIIFFQQLPCCV